MSASASCQASLIKYLQRRGGESSLALSLLFDIPSCRDRAYPFAVIDDTATYSRLLEAKFITDAGCVLKDVFLLVQKDQYSLLDLDHGPTTNTEIDAAWQRAFTSFKAQSEHRAPLLLSSQTGDQGRLARMAPLFFCRELRSYFHPVCSSCALPLQLCTDDDLLKANGLQPYSGSSKRYLHCAACCSRGQQEFYLFELDATDPVTVKDRWSLMDSFRSIRPETDPDGNCPCPGCPERGNCYGPSQNARTRIVPFSFYPFYFLIYEAPSLHGADFLDLVSGAGCEEIEALLDAVRNKGRIQCLEKLSQKGLLEDAYSCAGAEEMFLEVLSIKLNFLIDILRGCISKGSDSEATIDIERTWVYVSWHDFTDRSVDNFKVITFEEVMPESHNPADRIFASLPVRLGLLWFQTLLSNKSIRNRDIQDRVKQYTTISLDNHAASEKSFLFNKFRDPLKIFWNSEAKTLRPEWTILWEKALAPGFALLDAACAPENTISLAELSESMKVLLKEVIGLKSPSSVTADRSAKPLPAGTPAGDDPGGDRFLRGLVLKYLEKRRAELAGCLAPAPLEVEPRAEPSVRRRAAVTRDEASRARATWTGSWTASIRRGVLISCKTLPAGSAARLP